MLGTWEFLWGYLDYLANESWRINKRINNTKNIKYKYEEKKKENGVFLEDLSPTRYFSVRNFRYMTANLQVIQVKVWKAKPPEEESVTD